LRIFSAILLIATIFIQTFSAYIIKADYILNRTFISNTLCVNKEKPEMHCEGKCYLNKKLKQDKQDQQAPVSKNEQLTIQPFFVPELFSLPGTVFLTNPTFFIKDEGLAYSSSNSIFHPPSA
jgi:hypothetical protein